MFPGLNSMSKFKLDSLCDFYIIIFVPICAHAKNSPFFFGGTEFIQILTHISTGPNGS